MCNPRMHVYFHDKTVLQKLQEVPPKQKSAFIEKCILYYLSHSNNSINTISIEFLQQQIRQILYSELSFLQKDISDIQVLVEKKKLSDRNSSQIRKLDAQLENL